MEYEDDYEIYLAPKNADGSVGHVHLAYCDDMRFAVIIAKLLAGNHNTDDWVYLSSGKSDGNDFVIGGGWYYRYRKNPETGEIECGSLG